MKITRANGIREALGTKERKLRDFILFDRSHTYHTYSYLCTLVCDTRIHRCFCQVSLFFSLGTLFSLKVEPTNESSFQDGFCILISGAATVKRKKDVSIGLAASVSLATMTEKLARDARLRQSLPEIRHVALNSALFPRHPVYTGATYASKTSV